MHGRSSIVVLARAASSGFSRPSGLFVLRNLRHEPQRMLRAQVGLDRRDVKTVPGKHDHARVGNARGIAFDGLDRLQAAFVGAVMRDSLSSSSMSMRAEEAPNAARGLAFPISSSVHHRTCAADAELPSRARMVSAAHCRTPLVRMLSALALPLPRTGDPNRQSESTRYGYSLASCMQTDPPYLAPIRCQVRIFSASKKRATSAASSPALQLYPGGSVEAPKPGRSRRTTRYLSARCVTHETQAREDSELPCTITTVSGTLHGWPNQSSS